MDDKESIKDMWGFKMTRGEQCVEMKEGLIKVVERLNKEFPDMGKFRLKVWCDDTFYIHYKKSLFSREFGGTRIEVLEDRIGYRPSINKYEKFVDEYLQKFSQKHDIRIGNLSGF